MGSSFHHYCSISKELLTPYLPFSVLLPKLSLTYHHTLRGSCSDWISKFSQLCVLAWIPKSVRGELLQPLSSILGPMHQGGVRIRVQPRPRPTLFIWKGTLMETHSLSPWCPPCDVPAPRLLGMPPCAAVLGRWAALAQLPPQELWNKQKSQKWCYLSWRWRWNPLSPNIII